MYGTRGLFADACVWHKKIGYKITGSVLVCLPQKREWLNFSAPHTCIKKMQLDVEVSPPAFVRNLSKDMVPFVKAIPQSNFG